MQSVISRWTALMLMLFATVALAPALQGQQQAARATPIKVLLVTKGHNFDRAPFFAMFDGLGPDINVTHVEQPAAQEFWDPQLAAKYDVFVYYDAMGRTAMRQPDGTTTFDAPTAEGKRDFEALLKQGKGMVFLHHAIAAWNHTWPEYTEVVGGACDWGNRVTVRGTEYPYSGAQGGAQQHMTVTNPAHPVMQGLGSGFDIVDEAYLCPYFTDNFQTLLTTNFDPIPESFPGRYNRTPEQLAASNFRNHPRGSNAAAWVKTAENSPIVYLQNGHDGVAWQNPAYITMLTNAIKWAASPEAMAWARAHPQKIF